MSSQYLYFLFCHAEDVCPPVLMEFAHGNMLCTDGIKLGSVCKFSCDFGYKLHGKHEVGCGIGIQSGIGWDDKFPTCEGLYMSNLV